MINIKLDSMPNVVARLGFKHELPEPHKRGKTTAYIQLKDIETGDVTQQFEGVATVHSKDNYNKVIGRKKALANLFKKPENMLDFTTEERTEIWNRYMQECKFKVNIK